MGGRLLFENEQLVDSLNVKASFVPMVNRQIKCFYLGDYYTRFFSCTRFTPYPLLCHTSILILNLFHLKSKG